MVKHAFCENEKNPLGWEPLYVKLKPFFVYCAKVRIFAAQQGCPTQTGWDHTQITWSG